MLWYKNFFLYSRQLFLFGITMFLSSAILLSQSSVNRPLKILFVVGSFPAPSQTFILNIITGLIDKGHDVSIFSFRQGIREDMHPHIKKYQLLDRTIYKKLPSHLPACDIIFCQFGYIGKKLYQKKQLKNWLQKRKLAVCIRGADITRRTQKDPLIYQDMFKAVDLVLPVCEYFKQRLIALGCDIRKIKVHHSAINCSQFFFEKRNREKNDTIELIAVCRLVKKKGLDYAIKALRQVAHKYPRIHFTIVGEGSEKPYLELLIKQLKLEDKITLYGWANQQEVVSLLRKSHIFLLPSRTAPDGNEEGIPNALKEAMAMGLIAISTFHAGTPELIENGVTGFLVPQKSIGQLAKAIEYVIEHPEEWESIALAARKKIEEEFETQKSIEQLEAIFYELLGVDQTKEYVIIENFIETEIIDTQSES